MGHKSGFVRRRAGSALAAAALMAVARSAGAATFVWDGSTTSGYGYFKENDNWANNTNAPSPSASADLVFSSVNTHGFNPTADTTYSINSLNFSTSALAYTIAGGSLNIGAGGISDFSPTSVTETVSSPITLTAAQTWTLGQSLASPAGALTLSSSLNLNNQSLAIQANGSSALTANLTGTGTVFTAGSGTLTLNGSSSFTGNFYHTGAGLVVPSGASVTCGQLIVDASGFNVSGGTLTGQFVFGIGAAGPITSTFASGTCSGNEIDIGYGFGATLTQSGGTQSSTFLDVGAFTGGTAQAGTGVFNLSGGVVNTFQLDVGADDANGVLHQTGGTTNASSAFIGTTHNGSVTVGGNGTNFNVSGAVVIGSTTTSATASLNVSSGGYADITGRLSLNSSTATLILNQPQSFNIASLAGVAGSSIQLTNGTTYSALSLFGTSQTGVYSGNISGTGGVYVNATGLSQQLLGTNTYTGITTVVNGSLEMTTGASTKYQVSGGTLMLDFSNLGTSTVQATGTGIVVYNTSSITGGILTGSGTHNVSSVTSFTGTNFASGSTVNLNSGGATLTNTFVAGTVNTAATTTILGSFNLSGGTFNNSQGQYLVVGTGDVATTTAVIASGSLQYTHCEVGVYGQGLLVQTGGVQVGGELDIGTSNSTSIVGTFNLGGGSINMNGSRIFIVGDEGPGVVNQTGGTINANSVQIGSNQTPYSGQASVSGAGSSWNISGGGIQIGISSDPTIGQLTASNGASIVTTGRLKLQSAAASLNISGATVTAANLTGAAGAKITLADPTGGTALTLTNSDTSTYTYAGNITGTGSLLYDGSGQQVLSGTNSFTGKVNVTSGTLEMANGKSPLYQVSGGALILDASGSFSATGGAVANVGAGVITNNATFTGAINLYANGVLRGNGSASQINMIQANSGFFPGGGPTPSNFNTGGYCAIQAEPTGTTVIVNSPIYASAQASIYVDPTDRLTLAGGFNGGLLYVSGGGTVHVGSMNVTTVNLYGGSVQLTSPTSVLTAATVQLTLAAEQLDINKGAAIISGTTLSVLTAEVAAGYNLAGGGRWNGTPSITSSAAAADTSHQTTIGVIPNTIGGVTLYSAARPFHGVIPGPTSTLIAYTYFGDANLDGKVDGSDYSLIDAGYAGGGTKTGWYSGDFNYDGVVDASDYTLIDNAFNHQTASINPTALVASDLAPRQPVDGSRAAAAVVPAAIPEPATISLAACGILTASRLRRRVRPDG